MKIVLVHNHYQQPGGEDAVFAAEGELLAAHGHEVVRYTAHNDRVTLQRPLSLAASTLWNRAVHEEVRTLLARERPDVIHVHNTLPLISPAVYYAARAEGVPVVQTLHNYRLMCANALFFRDGQVCEQCLGKSGALPAVVHGCYRGSRAASGVVAAMITTHRAIGTWTGQVDRFIALTEFAKRKFIQGGLPPSLLTVKPHFVEADPGIGSGDGGYALYVGRLSPEKGVRTLLAAWRELGAAVPLKIVGDGPLADEVAVAATGSSIVEWLGHRSPREVAALLARASFLVCPSECYETFGRSVIEAFAAGVPVIATDLGCVASLVRGGATGLHFHAGRAESLAGCVEWAWTHASAMTPMRRQARAEYERLYTPERNYEMLMQIYEGAAANARARLS